MKRILVSIAIALSIIGCGRETITEDQETEVLINVQLPVFAPALGGLSQITAIVKAGPQDETVIAQGDLTITGSKATGTLMVLAGNQRVFILEAKGSDGQVMGSGQTTADVIAGQTITLDVTIDFRTGVVVINADITSASDDAPSLTPSEVVVAAYTAANEGKYSEVEKYIDPDSLRRLNVFSSTKEYWDGETLGGLMLKIEILEEEIRGEGATVTFYIYFPDIFNLYQGQPVRHKKMEALILKNGQWKIVLS